MSNEAVPEDLRKQYEIALRNYSCVMANGEYVAMLIERIADLQAKLDEYENSGPVQLIEYRERREAELQRLTDLVRFCRSHLYDENLISDEEYAALVVDADGGQRVARLEGYDSLKAEIQRLRTELETLKAQTDWEEDSARAAAMNSLEAENVRLRTENAMLLKHCPFEEENKQLKAENAALKRLKGNLTDQLEDVLATYATIEKCVFFNHSLDGRALLDEKQYELTKTLIASRTQEAQKGDSANG